MAAAERVELQPGTLQPLSLQHERELGALFGAYWPDGAAQPLAGFAEAVVRWVFERGLLMRPDSPALRAEGMVLVPVTPWGDVRAAWVVAPGVTLRHASPTPRRPSLYELGAERIDGGRA